MTEHAPAKRSETISKTLFFVFAALCFLPSTSSGVALFLGILLSITVQNPFLTHTKKIAPQLLSWSIVALGASFNVGSVLQAGVSGLWYTATGIALTLLLGWILGKILRTDRETSLLVSVGTAICGGSAIAAAAGAIRASEMSMTISLATVFALNACALFLFPWVGHHFGLTEPQFGLWSALAIHDTSSVVGASLVYGEKALEIATTTKLARALWIIPVTLLIGMFYRSESKGKAKFPTFILYFICTAALFSAVPLLRPVGEIVALIAKRGLVLTLFFIGANLNASAFKTVGPRPVLQGILLWIVVSIGSFYLVTQFLS